MTTIFSLWACFVLSTQDQNFWGHGVSQEEAARNAISDCREQTPQDQECFLVACQRRGRALD